MALFTASYLPATGRITLGHAARYASTNNSHKPGPAHADTSERTRTITCPEGVFQRKASATLKPLKSANSAPISSLPGARPWRRRQTCCLRACKTSRGCVSVSASVCGRAFGRTLKKQAHGPRKRSRCAPVRPKQAGLWVRAGQNMSCEHAGRARGRVRWPGGGQAMVRRWSRDGQGMVRGWSGDGQHTDP